MKTLTKSLLALSIAGFVSGLLVVTDVISVGNEVGWYMTLPLGAVFFGMFLITYMLEKEVARFDAEQESHPTVEQGKTRENGEALDLRTKHAH